MEKCSAVHQIALDETLSRRRLKVTLLATALVAVFLWTVTVPALAQGFSGGVVVQGETFDPYHPNTAPTYKTLYTNAGVITSTLQRAWHQKSDDICTSIQGFLGKPNALGNGYSPYNITCSMGDASRMGISANSITDGIHLTLIIPGNSLQFTTTQPTVCGKECDSTFSVTYELSVGLDVHGSGTQITVANVAAKIQHPNVQAQNLPASVIEELVGQQFMDNTVAKINYHGAELTNLVNSNLGILNALIGGLAQQNGYTHVLLSLEKSQVASVPPTSVLLQLNKDTFSIPSQGNGQITGAIRWDSSAGSPASCSSLTVAAKATVGYEQQGQVFAPQSVVGSVQVSGMKQSGGISECDYHITGLPYGIPLEIDAIAAGGWTGPDANDLKSPRPDGWSGHVTVDQPGAVVGAQRVARAPSVAAMPVSQAPVTRPAAAPANRKPVSNPARAPLRTTFINMTENNPHGVGTVGGIDFAIQFQEPPH
jgi:hypothetical protein